MGAGWGSPAASRGLHLGLRAPVPPTALHTPAPACAVPLPPLPTLTSSPTGREGRPRVGGGPCAVPPPPPSPSHAQGRRLRTVSRRDACFAPVSGATCLSEESNRNKRVPRPPSRPLPPGPARRSGPRAPGSGLGASGTDPGARGRGPPSHMHRFVSWRDRRFCWCFEIVRDPPVQLIPQAGKSGLAAGSSRAGQRPPPLCPAPCPPRQRPPLGRAAFFQGEC